MKKAATKREVVSCEVSELLDGIGKLARDYAHEGRRAGLDGASLCSVHLVEALSHSSAAGASAASSLRG